MASSLLSQLIRTISGARPRHGDYLIEAKAGLDDHELTDAERYLGYLLDQDEDIGSLSAAYCALLDETIEEQLFFQRNQRYRYQTFAEVSDLVYFDEAYMHNYMVGLAISLYLWPNHRAIRRFFNERLPTDCTGNYLEIGPGHGNFLLRAMRETSYSNFTGVDVSPTSISLTKKIVQSALPEKTDQLTLILADFLSSDLPCSHYDSIVMGEVLEHVEDPQSMLDRIAELLSPEGFSFMTTCMNAPELDHIYLYRKESEVSDMISKAGLEVVQSLNLPHHGYSLDQCIKLNLPINVAYELKHCR